MRELLILKKSNFYGHISTNKISRLSFTNRHWRAKEKSFKVHVILIFLFSIIAKYVFIPNKITVWKSKNKNKIKKQDLK